MTLPKMLARLPTRFQWTLHNVVAHPLSEVAFQLWSRKLSNRIHDSTIPDQVGSPRDPDG